MPKPQPKGSNNGWLGAMKEHFRRGELTAAAALFDDHSASAPYEAVLLRARIYLKQQNSVQARTLLESAPPPVRDPVAKVQREALLGAAYARAGRYDAADVHFETGLSAAAKLDDPELLEQIAYQRSVRYALEHRLDDAREQLAIVRRGRSARAHADAAFAEWFILTQERRYVDQAAVLASLLSSMDPNARNDEETRLYAVWNLAILARELYLPDSLPLLERHIDSEPWPADYERQHFESLKALGWCHALRGDYFNAFRRLKAAQQVCTDRARLTIAHLDRAYLARCKNEMLWHRQELAEAEDLARTIDWKREQGEERVALLLLAELFAPIDRGKASHYIAQYDELPRLQQPLQHFSHDGRLDALADYSRAVVDLALSSKKTAVALLKRTEKTYEDIRYDWRAGRCALRLHEITGDSKYLRRAAERLRHYMNSWLGDQLQQSEARSQALNLPTVQRKVFDYICQGLSNAEIAEQMERSEFTVRNHVKALLKRFSVSSRSALVAEAARRNLL
jgi:DNA-binding CsgD family transcriptional regulator